MAALAGISIGSVSVSVVPDARLFASTLRAELLPQADALGAEMGQRIAAGINAALHDVGLDVAANTAAADAALGETKTLAEDLGKTQPVITPEVKNATADAALAETKAAAEDVGKTQPVITPEVNSAAAVAQLTALAAASGKASDAAKYAYAAQTLMAAAEKASGDSAGGATPQVAALSAAAVAAGAAAGRGAGGWGLLTRQFVLFGGALGSTALIGSVAGWHIALDVILESAIALVAAIAALAVGLYAMVPAAQDIYTHLQAVSAVNSALGSSIPPLTGKFQALQQAMAPQVVEAFGGALNAVSNGSGILAKVAAEVVTGIDNVIAKIDIWANSQKSMGGVLQSGVGFLHQFASILGEVFLALNNLVKADPGTAHFLLDVVQGFGKVLDVVTMLPTPILFGALALHSFLLWGGLLTSWAVKAGTMLTGVGSSIVTLGLNVAAWGEGVVVAGRDAEGAARGFAILDAALAGLDAVNPLVWVAAVVAAIGGIAYIMTQADHSTKAFIADLNTGLAQMPASQAITQISVDIGKINQQIAQVPVHLQATNDAFNKATTEAGKGFEGWLHDLAGVTNGTFSFSKTVSDLGKVVVGGAKSFLDFWAAAGQGAGAGAQVNAYKGAIVSLTGQQANLFGETGNLIKQGYTYNQSLALMGLAGVQASDSLALMRQKVDNLITGYQNMSVQGGTLSNSVNAITFASEQQSSKISQLTQSWTAFITTVTGGESSFITAEQGIYGMGAAASGAAASMTVSNGRTSLVTRATASLGSAATSTSTSIGGLSQSSLQLAATFQTAITNGSSLFNSLTTQASAAGLGTQGYNLLTQAGKDYLQQLLPMAKGSQTMTSELYALAQQAGYTGANSFQALAKWIGNTANPAKNLQGIVAKLTTASAGLTTDVQNLANAIQGNLNAAMAAAILQANGGQKAFDTFATAVVHNKGNVDADKASASALATELITLTGNTTDAKNEFVTMSEKLGLTKTQADALWKSVTTGGQDMTNTHPARQTMISDLVSAGLNATTAMTDVDNYTAAVLHNGSQSQAARTARTNLINDIIATGQHAHDTTGQIANMIAQIVGIPKSEALQIVEKATGSYTISGGPSSGAPGGSKTNYGSGLIPGGQTGMRIPGYGGGDVFPAMLEPGETVVPKHLTPAVAPLMKAHGVPGFASGAYAGSGGAGTYPGLGTFAVTSHTALIDTTAQALVSAMNTAIQAATNPALGAFSGALGGSASANRALGQQMAAAMGWTGAQWAALNQVEMMEAGWSTTAKNPTSNAYGIAQFINGPGEYAQYGGNSSTAGGQITGFLNYVKDRYGTPTAALAHEESYHWYDSGGWMPPGLSLAMNGTGKPEPVLSGRQWDMLSSAVSGGDGGALAGRATGKKLDQMISLLEKAPQRTAGGVGEALNGTARGAAQRSYFRTR